MTRNQQAKQFSNRLFTRFYVVLVLMLMVLGSGLQYVLNRMDEAQFIHDIKQIHQPLFASVSQVLSVHDAAQWPQLLGDIQARTETDLWLISLQDFAADQDTLDQLSTGEVLALFDVQDQLTLYQRLEGSEQVLGITPKTRLNQEQRLWVLPVFYLLLALVLYVLIRPFARQLIQLKQAAVDLGQGDFTARVEVPASTTLAPIADAFNAMIRKIELLMLTQRDLVNGVSHELRTPLARLKFAFEDLSTTSNQSQLQATVTDMRGDVKELEQLIDEMLRYAEINQIEAFEKQPVHVHTWLSGLVDQYHSDVVPIQLQFDPDLHASQVMCCHEQQLTRALSNVIRNALSFARTRCLISARLDGNHLVVEVSDDGVGLDAAQADRVFEPFYKVKNPERQAGYGLGLSIARNIINKHQGTLSVVAGPLSGACFRFVLPLD